MLHIHKKKKKEEEEEIKPEAGAEMLNMINRLGGSPGPQSPSFRTYSVETLFRLTSYILAEIV